jgi:hypothetical protein
LTITVSAFTVTDGKDDVMDGKLNKFVSRPDIDIRTVTCEISGDTVTLTMTVEGNIVDSEYIIYTIKPNGNISDFFSGTVAQYQNGISYVMKDMAAIPSDFLISEGNTIIFSFTWSDSTEISNVMGSAMEHSSDYKNNWIDYAPDDYLSVNDVEDQEPDDETDESGDEKTGDDIIIDNKDETITEGNGSDGGIPGFELILIMLSILVVLFLKRKNKL